MRLQASAIDSFRKGDERFQFCGEVGHVSALREAQPPWALLGRLNELGFPFIFLNFVSIPLNPKCTCVRS